MAKFNSKSILTLVLALLVLFFLYSQVSYSAYQSEVTANSAAASGFGLSPYTYMKGTDLQQDAPPADPAAAAAPAPAPQVRSGALMTGDGCDMNSGDLCGVELPEVFGEYFSPLDDDMAGPQAPAAQGVGLASSLLPREVAKSEDFGKFVPADILIGQNFLDPRMQIGFPESIGGVIRNANQQIRAEPPNPKQAYQWNNSTIMPDLMQRPLN